jgi:predicted transposase/invertase (TIGR01784 family)
MYGVVHMFEIHTIELKKKLNGEDRVDDWIRLFNAKTEEELDMIKTSNPGIREAMRELRVMSLGKRLRLIHEEHLKEIRDRHMIEDEAREEGERVGRAEGSEQKLMDLISRKLAKGQSVEQIAEALEEEPEVVSRLIQKLESK